MKICVTGASSGIGRELVKQLIQDGHSVWGIARRRELLEELSRELKTDRFFFVACDVSIQNEVRRVFIEMDKNGFMPEAVVLAAGAFLNDIDPGFEHEVFKKNIDVNLYSATNFAYAFLPEFIKRGSGQFVAICSTTALKPSLRGIGYPASKAALGIAFRGMNLAYRKRNVIFSTIYLGPVATEMWNAKKSFVVLDKAQAAQAIRKVIKTRKSVYYYPFFSTLLSRASFLPDKWYIWLTELFR